MREGLRSSLSVTGAVFAAAVTGLFGGEASAQTRSVPYPRVNAERLHFNPGAQDSFVADMGELLPAGTSRVGLGLQHVDGPSVTRLGGENASLRLDSRLLGNFTGAFAPNRWVQLELQLPVIFHQSESEALSSRGFAPVAQNGYGMPLAGLRVGVLRQADGMPVDLALAATIGLPMGHPGALGRDDQVPLRPAVSVGRSFGRVKVGGGLHAQLRSQENFAFRGVSGSEGDTLNHELGFTVAAAGEVLKGLRAELGLESDFALGNPGNTTQAWLGARYAVTQGMEVFALAGPGFGSLVGTPRYRAMAGVSFGLGKREETSTVRPRAAEENSHSKTQPQVAAQVGAAQQPAAAAPAPATPSKPEPLTTLDGTPSANAAPTPTPTPTPAPVAIADKDGDGVPDSQDRCPTKAAPGTEHGCGDADEDLVADHLDNCRFQPGPKENQGCPTHDKQLVLITHEKLQLLDKVSFAPGKATLLPRSKVLLDQIGRIVLDHPELERIVIEAHTDDAGRADRNLKLSQERAEAVRRYLMSLGVPGSRLTAKGRGMESPLQPATTAEGREANRRVEFLITESAGVLDEIDLLPLE